MVQRVSIECLLCRCLQSSQIYILFYSNTGAGEGNAEIPNPNWRIWMDGWMDGISEISSVSALPYTAYTQAGWQNAESRLLCLWGGGGSGFGSDSASSVPQRARMWECKCNYRCKCVCESICVCICPYYMYVCMCLCVLLCKRYPG